MFSHSNEKPSPSCVPEAHVQRDQVLPREPGLPQQPLQLKRRHGLFHLQVITWSKISSVQRFFCHQFNSNTNLRSVHCSQIKWSNTLPTLLSRPPILDHVTDRIRETFCPPFLSLLAFLHLYVHHKVALHLCTCFIYCFIYSFFLFQFRSPFRFSICHLPAIHRAVSLTKWRYILMPD